MAARIPSDLIEMLKQQRVIPFIGSGVSAGVGLPDWDTLLRAIAAEVQGAPPYDQIHRFCQGDNLQIAEYLFLKFDKSIGPLRHRMAMLLNKHEPVIGSTPHVELVNLNPQQIYTTNYDEILEKTFGALGEPYAVVALPKHIALADRSKTQIVKYHGDLRYDSTLVLTESSYYSRLEFESPMDLKFRSDLLGRSVLFIGYSFRDVNIRIIWFKLMEMMRDVPEQDRPSSFIVRFERNEVLEELYRAVGIKTICLDPNGSAKNPADRTKLLGRFMLDLSLQSSDDAVMPGSDRRMYLSTGMISSVQEELASSRMRFSFNGRATGLLRHASNRRIPSELAPTLGEAFRVMGKSPRGVEAVPWALKYMDEGHFSPGAAYVVVRGLLQESGRKHVLSHSGLSWEKVWSLKLSPAECESLIKTLRAELNQHGMGMVDHDLAYAADLVKRIETGMLVAEPSADLMAQAAEALAAVELVYGSVKNLTVSSDSPPNLDDLIEEISAAIPDEDWLEPYDPSR